MLTLYELTDAYRALADMDAEDVTVNALLNELEGDITIKAENIAKLVRSLEAEAEVFDAEYKRLAEASNRRKLRAQGLKFYLLAGLQAAELQQVKGTLFTVARQKSPPSCEVENADLIAKEFIRVVPAQEVVDRKAIIDHWKQTGDVPAGTSIVQGEHLRIR